MVGESKQERAGTEGRAEEGGQVFAGGWMHSRSRATLVKLGSLMYLVHRSSFSYCFHSVFLVCKLLCSFNTDLQTLLFFISLVFNFVIPGLFPSTLAFMHCCGGSAGEIGFP